MLFEIRNYHYDRSQWEAFTQWAQEEAVPFLKANLDIVGIWFDNGEPPEIMGSDPMDLKHGTANVTTIIRWESMEKRNQGYQGLGETWQEIWSRHPDPNGYLHMEVRFAEGV